MKRSWVVLGAVCLLPACGSNESVTPVALDSGAGGAEVGPTPTDGGAEASPALPEAAVDASSVALPKPVVVRVADGRSARFLGMAHDANGNVLAVGQLSDATDPADMTTMVAKLNAKGELDASFAKGGVFSHNVAAGKSGEVARGIVVQKSGKIVVAGLREHAAASDATRDIFLLRLNADGSIDSSFGTGGVATYVLSAGELVNQWGLTLLASDDLVIVGARKAEGKSVAELAVLRVKGTDGSLDASFGVAGVASFAIATTISPRTAIELSDKSLIVCGYTNAGGNKPIVAKLTEAGKLDTTFATGGVYFPETGVPSLGTGGNAEAYAVALQGDKIVTAGYGKYESAQPANGWISLRLTSGGALDTTFGAGGHVHLPFHNLGSNGRSLVVLPDGRIVLIGQAVPAKANADAATPSPHAAIAVLLADGKLDPSFAGGAPALFDFGGATTGRSAHVFWGIGLSPDKKTLSLVGTKGGIVADADAGVAATPDEAVFMSMTP